MQELSKQNIRLISQILDRSGISFSHLREDLIDHFCCEIEEKLAEGITFSQAFESIKHNLGIKSLQQVQEKTLLLIDKNYCAMKTTMKFSAIISIILLIVGILFKINHWPWAGIMITLGFFILCFFFLPSAYYIMHREKRDRRLIFLFISAFLGSCSFFLGILFKVQHWPGGAPLLTLGIIIMCVLFFPALLRYLFRQAKSGKEKIAYTFAVISGITFFLGFLFKAMHWPGGNALQTAAVFFLVGLFIPFYTFVRYSKSKHVEAGYIYLIAAVSWIVMFGMLVSLSRSKNVLQTLQANHQILQQQKSDFEMRNESIYRLATTSDLSGKFEEIKRTTDNLDSYIQDLKLEIIRNLNEQNLQAINEEGSIDLSRIIDDTNTEAPFKVLIGEKQSGKALELKNKINATRNALIDQVDREDTVARFINTCLITDLPGDAPQGVGSWEMLYFSRASVTGCMEVLTAIQRNLRIAENEVISYLQNL